MMDLLQSATLVVLGIGLVLNALATRRMIKAFIETQNLLRSLMVYTVLSR